MSDDAELLQRFVHDRSQAAFAELVARRIDLVYAVALRQVAGDVHLAQDVTQKVFADLARKAPTLLGRTVLSGWLYRSAQFAASDVVRGERRRRAREQATFTMEHLTAPEGPATDWDRLRPFLDEALGELEDPDRDAVALRFFEGRAFADVGRALALSEEAARKRVDRALDKLAAVLARRGVKSTAAAVGAVLAYPLGAAPAGLAGAVAGAALGAGGAVAVGGAVAGGAAGVKLLVGAGVAAAVATGGWFYQAAAVRARDTEIRRLEQSGAALHAQVGGLETRVRAAEARATQADEDVGRLLDAIGSRNGAGLTPRAAAGADQEATGPITHDLVTARYRRAQELARTGDPAEALRELLWCYDVGMVQVGSYSGVRQSFLLSTLVELGKRHPPALAALRERRDALETRVNASATDYEAASGFASINRVLKEPERTLAIFEGLGEGDGRRRALAMNLFDELVERRRYRDALEGQPPAMLVQQFERNTAERALPANVGDPARLRQAQRRYAVTATARNVEVLAGGGQVEAARALAGRLQAYDPTLETRALLQAHAERAGQPDLLRGAGN